MKTIKNSRVLFVCILLTVFVHDRSLAQQQGNVEYARLGLSFTIPDGWVGREMDNGFIIGSHTEPGAILLTSHEYTTLAQLEAEFRAGLQEVNGTALELQGDIEHVSGRSIGAAFNGTVEWQEARSYIIGTINPHGAGITVFATAAADQYSPGLREAAIQIARSFKFTQIDKATVVSDWKKRLTNARLTYMDSYYSSGSGGYSNREVIDLCAAGTFNYNEKSNLSIDSGGAHAYSRGSGKGSGKWEIITNRQNQPVLRLTFYSGEVYDYVLGIQDEKTMLNGYRYYRTYKGEYAPQCFEEN